MRMLHSPVCAEAVLSAGMTASREMLKDWQLLTGTQPVSASCPG